ncbi:MAG: flagellar protein FlbB [Xanthobacteraceae bacterium]|jgi:flagellar motility protein MotE (MotC chaperone)
MKRFVRDLRLIPIALIASACLLTLKTADLFFHGSLFLSNSNAPSSNGEVAIIRPMPDATQPPGSALSWAQQMFNFPNSIGAAPIPSQPPVAPRQLADTDSPDITGSVTPAPAGDGKPAAAGAAVSAPAGKDGKPVPLPSGTVISTDASMPSGAERAILERLQARRQELDTRARELDLRESLIQNAEKRMDARLDELKQVEERIKVETQQKDDAEAARLKGLVTMYENMKPRDAAKIFNGLDSTVLLSVVSAINPRTMAEILAQMSPEVAQRLTVELASKAQQAKADSPAELPKIQGQPTPLGH